MRRLADESTFITDRTQNPTMKTLRLETDEIRQIEGLIDTVVCRFDDTESQVFLDEIGLYAHQMPWRVRKFINDFRHGYVSEGICTISGYPIDDERLGPTPEHWRPRKDLAASLRERTFQFLCASLLGDPFGWGTQQDGRIMHDVLPIAEYENEQLGFSSREALTWHTEDAFHPFRPDYLALFCLRNPDGVGTHCGKPDFSRLSEVQLDHLFGSNYTIKPDNSHLSVNNTAIEGNEDPRTQSFEDILRMSAAPEKVSVLFGNRSDPYIRIDPYFMEVSDNAGAQEALEALIRSIDDNYVEQPISQGDILFINNLRVVHGRRPFTAKYDGTDRWLKRILVARDLSKSRERRTEDFSRVIR